LQKGELLQFVLSDWCRRVIRECAAQGCAVPPKTREAIQECFSIINQIEALQKKEPTKSMKIW
jgi:hypothetical protein